MSDIWDPSTYERFAEERRRPIDDLLNRLAGVDARSIVDLGCGTGAATALLAARWPAADITGIDSSASMLALARERHGEGRAVLRSGAVRWLQADIASWEPQEPVDLVFSNAALHWVDDHPVVLARLLRCVVPGGTLAVQMPRNFGAASHQALSEVIAEGGWEPRIGSLRRVWPTIAAEAYIDVLAGDAAALDVWETTYFHRLSGADPVMAWIAGAAMRPILAALSAAELATLKQAYAQRLRLSYPPAADGTTLYPFRRLFVVARRREA